VQLEEQVQQLQQQVENYEQHDKLDLQQQVQQLQQQVKDLQRQLENAEQEKVRETTTVEGVVIHVFVMFRLRPKSIWKQNKKPSNNCRNNWTLS
jgi:hypothetical protein